MAERYLRVRCRGRRKNTPLDCRSSLSGLSLDTILNHNYDERPITDMRYCRNCQTMFRITINNLNEIPVIEAVSKDEKINYVEMEEVFGFVEVRR